MLFEWLGVHVKLDVQLTDDSSDWELSAQTAWGEGGGGLGCSPLFEMFVSTGGEKIVPYLVLSIFILDPFFFLMDSSRFLIGHNCVCLNSADI